MLAGNDHVRPRARRKRPTISCSECHRRKQKCNRRLPCANCIKRGKSNACLYPSNEDRVRSDTPPPELQDQPTLTTVISPAYEAETLIPSRVDQVALRRLGYTNDTKGTRGIIHGLGESVELERYDSICNNISANRYPKIIRELPSWRHIDVLVKGFFTNVAWHYDVVDEAAFSSQLCEWRNLSYDQLRRAPDGLPKALWFFPALLFQIIALSLLFQPLQYDEILDDLKVSADMRLSDLATDFSDAGRNLGWSLGKGELTLTTVQAGLLRASFEKTTGAVVEAWHTLGGVIRDAQELGLHRMVLQPTQRPGLEKQSYHEVGRRVWLMLHLWDAHMAVVLGRPMATRVDPDEVAFPVSWNYSSFMLNSPQPRDVILCGYHTAYKYLQDIHNLEGQESGLLLANNIHESILNNIANLPAWATDYRSHRHQPVWLSATLETMRTNLQFVLLALHRPFIFISPSSRRKAFDSAVGILESQARLFALVEDSQHSDFSLVFATFDAMVLVAAMHLRFTNEFVAELPSAKRNLEWGLDRRKLLQTKNHLASSAFNAVQQLYQRLSVDSSSSQLAGASHEVAHEQSITQEAAISQLSWDDTMYPSFEDLLSTEPLDELLFNDSIGMQSEDQTISSSDQDYTRISFP